MENQIEKLNRIASLEEEHAIKLQGESMGLGDTAVHGLRSIEMKPYLTFLMMC